MTPRASVVVPARDAAVTLPRTLAALRDQDLPEPYEVVVVDDGSRDETAAIAERAGVMLVRQPPMGPGAARNRGVAAAAGRLLAFTDADCFPERGWLAAGLRALERADLVQGQVEPDPASPMGPFDRSIWAVEENGLYETANLFCTRELFERLGGFEDWLVPETGKALAEDVWFGWQARRTGVPTAFCPEARVHHAVFPRSAVGHVMERRRLVHFPAIARRVPELRTTLFVGRVFLNRRTLAFDAALGGLAVAALARTALPLLAAAPYGAMVARHALAWRRRSALVAAGEVAADAVGFAALACGSVRHRSLLL